MTENQSELSHELGRPRRFRYLIDIIVLVGATVLLEIALSVIYVPDSLRSQLVSALVVQLLAVAIGCLLIRLRGERLADIGLKQPRSWLQTIMIGLAIAAVIFALIYISEKIGVRRDLSRFKDVQGNPGLTLHAVLYALVGAGFYEEFMFRGFLFHGLANFFGASPRAWIAACLLQGLLFGLAHAYQNPFGVVLTGSLGVLMGFVFLASGRNLWPIIIGHGVYDASRFVLFYFQGPQGG